MFGTAAKGAKAKCLQVIVDHASRFAWAYATATNTTTDVIKGLTGLFADGQRPKLILSDRATNYGSHRFADFLQSHGVVHIRT